MNLVTTLGPSDGAALIVAVAVKGTLLLLTAFLVVGLMRRASAATRHAVWTVAFAAVLALPALFAVLPVWQVPVLTGPSPTGLFAPPPPVAPAAPAVAPSPPPSGARPDQVWDDGVAPLAGEHREGAAPGGERIERVWLSASQPTPLEDGRAWLLLAWAVGAGLVAARWVFGLVGAWRLVQRAEPVYDLGWLELKERVAFGLDLKQPVRLLRSERVTVPVACGLSSPVVLLPAAADAWPEDRREVVLTHELAHILRRDCATQLVAQAALVVHWFNPLAWLAYRRSLLDREHACDDFVLNNGNRASDYAGHLVHIARGFRRESLALSAAAPMARRSNLEGRILSILEAGQNRRGASRGMLAVFGVLALGLVLPLAAFQPVESEPGEGAVSLARAGVEAAPAPQPEPVRSALSDDRFRWEGRVGAGGFVEVHGVNGSVRARTGAGDQVRVEAEKKSRRGREDEVEIVVHEGAGGVVVCAVYPGQRAGCRPGQGAEGTVRDSDVSVQFEIVLPEDVRLVARTVNGSVKTGTLGADVEAATVNGSIETASRGDVAAKTVNGSVRAEAAGTVRAATVNGSISARMGRADWDGTLDLGTTNGSITLELPDDFSATVRAEVQTGSIKSDFPLRVRRTGYTGAEAEGQIGDGGRLLNLEVLNGSIKLRRAVAFGTSIGDVRDHQRRVEEQARRVEEQYHEQYHDLAAQALADIGPVMEHAVAEAGRAMDEIDFEGEVAAVLAAVDWEGMRGDIEDALAEVEAKTEWNLEHGTDWEHEWDHAEDEIADALDGVRDELADVEEELAEGGRRGSAERELRAAQAALRQAERALERALRDARQRLHRYDADRPDEP